MGFSKKVYTALHALHGKHFTETYSKLWQLLLINLDDWNIVSRSSPAISHFSHFLDEQSSQNSFHFCRNARVGTQWVDELSYRIFTKIKKTIGEHSRRTLTAVRFDCLEFNRKFLIDFSVELQMCDFLIIERHLYGSHSRTTNSELVSADYQRIDYEQSFWAIFMSNHFESKNLQIIEDRFI